MDDKIHTIQISKEEMYLALHGREVKCITTQDNGIMLFSMQDLKNGVVYLMDEIRVK